MASPKRAVRARDCDMLDAIRHHAQPLAPALGVNVLVRQSDGQIQMVTCMQCL